MKKLSLFLALNFIFINLVFVNISLGALNKDALMSLKVPEKVKVIESKKTVYKDVNSFGDDFLFYQENLDLFDDLSEGFEDNLPEENREELKKNIKNNNFNSGKNLGKNIKKNRNNKNNKVPQKLINVYGAQSLFKDVGIDYNYYEAVVALEKIGVMTGRSSGMNVDSPIIRAEIAKIMVKIKQIKLEKNLKISEKVFLDVKKGEWYEIYVNNIAKKGIMVGFPEKKKFGVTENITYGEFSKILVKTFAIGIPRVAQNNEHWAQPFVDIVVDKGLVPKGLDREKNYGRVLTRGEVADFIYRTLNLVNNEDEHYVDEIQISIPKFNINLPASRTLIYHPSTWITDLTLTGGAFYDDDVLHRTILFAHSSIWDFDPTPFGPVFKPLIGGTLKFGDKFSIKRDGKLKNYKILKSLLINQTGIGYLGKNSQVPVDTDFILFTCGENVRNRWIYYAKEV